MPSSRTRLTHLTILVLATVLAPGIPVPPRGGVQAGLFATDAIELAVLHNPHDVDRLANGHTLITDGGDASGAASRVIEVDASGSLLWSYGSGLNFAHGAQRLPNGNTLIADTGHDRVLEITTAGQVVWNSQSVTLGDGSHLRYPNDAEWLSTGNRLLITDRDNHRVLEIARDGTVLWQFGATGQAGDDATHLGGPHNADRLPNGNTVIADSGNNRVLEVTPAGAIAWEYRPTGADRLDWPRDADRLPNGNTLITDSRHARLLEVTLAGDVAWQYGGLQLPYDADRLANGNTLISKAGTGQVIEVATGGTIVWSYPAGLVEVDLPWPAVPQGKLAVRIQAPQAGAERYSTGTPVVVWLAGGEDCRDLTHGLPAQADDLTVLTFLFPGCADVATGRASSGSYDYRGRDTIRALRDVALYAAGKLADRNGRMIDQVVPVPVLHKNIGLIGASNGGNIIVAVAARHGAELAGYLRYLVQWETPVSSQIATRDVGRVWMQPFGTQGNYVNPRYLAYGPLTLAIDYGDLAYNPAEPYYPVFHDGGGLPPGAPPDGAYTTVPDETGNPPNPPDPDLDGSGALESDEDFPLGAYTGEDGSQRVFSRAVTRALFEQQILAQWPLTVATPAEAAAYWDIRESVRLYDDAVAAVPELEGMVLANVRDHVQSAPDKPHIRQAFEGWRSAGAWVRINPRPSYVLQADGSIQPGGLPDNPPNTAPVDWSDAPAYCMPQAVPAPAYQLAAVWQMADRAQVNWVYLPVAMRD